MRFCQSHWEALREAIADRGLDAWVAEDGYQAASKLRRQLEGEDSVDSFDPLMWAHNAIASNVLRIVAVGGGSPLYLLQGDDPEDPVEGHPQRTWPRCPVCYLNLAHEINCTDARCVLPKTTGYDWMIDRAASDALEHWQSLGVG